MDSEGIVKTEEKQNPDKEQGVLLVTKEASESKKKIPPELPKNLPKECPSVIVDPETGVRYRRGRLLGKGGFARCYEVIQMDTKRAFAGKVVNKQRISKPNQRAKMQREIAVHCQLRHPNIVAFHKHFDDEENFYIILELCSQKSLAQILKLRRCFTEPEVRYFVLQIIDGLRYLHNSCVIHRDLKLGNMFLTENMEVKIGDFGLATKVEFEGDEKRTMCGTPNYIAPEVLDKVGHSFEADVWAIGCILYTMLVGRPPFETESLKETYTRIKRTSYSFPSHLSQAAKELITDILTSKPENRPSLDEIASHKFFTGGFVPDALSPSACHSTPEFGVMKVLVSDKEGAVVTDNFCRLRRESTMQRKGMASPLMAVNIDNNNCDLDHRTSTGSNSRQLPDTPTRGYQNPVSASPYRRSMDRKAICSLFKCVPVPMSKVYEMLTTCLDHIPKGEYLQTPKHKPTAEEALWISKWVDYSNKYGFGYQLSNGTVGVMFNDRSKIIFPPDRNSVQYHTADDQSSHYPLTNTPQRLSKKATLLDYFATYMDDHLPKGNVQKGKETQRLSSPKHKVVGLDLIPDSPVQPHLDRWTRSRKAIAMYLSCGILQVNFFADHTKIILNYNNSDHLVTYINHNRVCTTYRLIHIAHHGCSRALQDRLEHAVEVLDSWLEGPCESDGSNSSDN
ncbi:hypothetical protein BSL78_26075 [Apostichopus japonicus]|uniref:Serine/threonine-protein kinase PLK n=1 Tax=Stichopus japonicus TaxID=307972 RepID=A0A2G8JMT5_STIJA|nr:hypothetical protein BSL78_26075 [Apostichopus japonicus]